MNKRSYNPQKDTMILFRLNILLFYEFNSKIEMNEQLFSENLKSL